MTSASPANPQSDLVHSLSAALHKTPIMARLHDPDHALADETARQLVESLERIGIMVTMNADPLSFNGNSLMPAAVGSTDAEREIERLRQEQDDYLDEALKETFPASDSIAPGHPHPKKPD